MRVVAATATAGATIEIEEVEDRGPELPPDIIPLTQHSKHVTTVRTKMCVLS